jgi:NitT/TauT family transport system ATP-binding protein
LVLQFYKFVDFTTAGAKLNNKGVEIKLTILWIEMLKVLINLWNKSDKSILFITHEIDEALTVANRILVLGKRPTKVIKEVILGKDRIGSRDINSDEFIGHRKEIINLLG